MPRHFYPWGKLSRPGEAMGWLSLEAHSLDVAWTLHALLEDRVIRDRADTAAGRPLTSVDLHRLAFLTCLHDVGKGIVPFQRRIDPDAPMQGHIKPVASLMGGGGNAGIISGMMLDAIGAWVHSPDYLSVLYSHHGKPRGERYLSGGLSPAALALWDAVEGMDPVAATDGLIRQARLHFPLASSEGGHLPDAPGFMHLLAGLLMLADWIGSTGDLHPLMPRDQPLSRLRDRGFYEGASHRIRSVGVGVPLPDADLSDAELIGRSEIRPVQGVARHVAGQTLCIEAETGSGKTEAALLHWVALRRLGLVDGLYVALPTRTSAAQIFERVVAFVGRYLGTGAASQVVLAAPGYAEGGGLAPPSSDGVPVDRDTPWAAEHPKRYLAASVAVGTVDQALMAVLPVPHAHMRFASLSRSLLVVDEVHASEPYGAALVATLLDAHRAAGGRSLLLSATLGASARAALLGTEAVPPAREAVAQDYPSASWVADGCVHLQGVDHSRPVRDVSIHALPIIDDPGAIAAEALGHADRGARVLVVRNTVAGACAVLKALETLDPEVRAAFRVEGVRTLHHGRFAVRDRKHLDAAVGAGFGTRGTAEGVILVGTQTLEQSLDIDADVLLTDLCPADVLLQRLGRLHRHDGRLRPDGYGRPTAFVAVPGASLTGLLKRPSHGLGMGRDGRGVYRGLVGLEATLRAIRERPVWTLPTDNRTLVEGATNPDLLKSLLVDLVAGDPDWKPYASQLSEHVHMEAAAGRRASRDMSGPFREWATDGGHALTRLGGRDRRLTMPASIRGPFGRWPGPMVVPEHMAPGLVAADEPHDFVQEDGAIGFSIGAYRLRYDRFGLSRSQDA